MSGEYMKKDCVPFEYVKAVGYPYRYYSAIKGELYAKEKLNKLLDLMNKHNIKLPVVDTSCRNKILNDFIKKKSGR